MRNLQVNQAGRKPLDCPRGSTTCARLGKPLHQTAMAGILRVAPSASSPAELLAYGVKRAEYWESGTASASSRKETMGTVRLNAII